MTTHVTPVTAAELDRLLATSDVPVVVDFWATWCGPCKQMAPALDQVAGNLAGRVKVVKIDIDENPEAAARFGIRGVPTLITFKDGAPVSSSTGAKPARAIETEISAAL